MSTCNRRGNSHGSKSRFKKITRIPKSTYERHLLRSKAGGSYFLFFRHYCKLLNRLPALFLQDLINLCSIPGAKTTEENGKVYTLCTSEFLITSGLMWTKEEQKYHFGILEEKGYIERMRKGMDGPRWVRIDFEKIEDDLDEADGVGMGEKSPDRDGGKIPHLDGGKIPPKNHSYFVTIQNGNKHGSTPLNGVSGKLPFNGSGIHVAKPFGVLAAKELFDGLAHAGRITRRPNFGKWANEFEGLISRLVEVRGYPRKKAERYVIDLVKDHVANIRDRFQPKHYSATSFCSLDEDDGFLQVENAYQRRREDGEEEGDSRPILVQFTDSKGRTVDTIRRDGVLRPGDKRKEGW